MKVLLIDDERLARNELRRLLAEFPSLTIVGEAGSADEADALLPRLLPDLRIVPRCGRGFAPERARSSIDKSPLHGPTLRVATELRCRVFEKSASASLRQLVLDVSSVAGSNGPSSLV